MTNAELIAKIKAEIEKLKKAQEVSEDKDYAQYELDVACGYDMACDDLLSFLSTLESEKPMNLEEDLNDEIKKYIEEYGYEKGADKLLIAIVARHFAKWGAEHTKK